MSRDQTSSTAALSASSEDIGGAGSSLEAERAFKRALANIIHVKLNNSEYESQRKVIDSFHRRLADLQAQNDYLRTQLKDVSRRTYSSTIKALTEQLRLREYEDSTRAMDAMNEHLPYFVIIQMSEDGQRFVVVHASNNFEVATGYSPSEFIGKDFSMLVRRKSGEGCLNGVENDEHFGEELLWSAIEGASAAPRASRRRAKTATSHG